MPTNSALSTQKFQNSLPVNTALSRAASALKTPAGARFAKIAGLSFAASFPVLGIVDPEVLLASGLADVHTVEVMFSRAEAALRTMAVMELFATGGVAVLALAAMAGVGYLRTRYKAARQEELAAE
jgi:hypothetical protein